MIKRLIAPLSLMLVIIFSSDSFAYRPLTTEDAGVAGKDAAQLEISWDYLKWNDSNENILLFVPIYGIAERVELSFEIPYLFHRQNSGENGNGIGDINIAGKFLISEENRTMPALTLKGAIKTKSGNKDRGLGSGDTDYSMVAVASKCMGNVSLHAIFGYTFVGNGGDENIRDIYLYGLAADYRLTDSLNIVAEIAGNRHPDRTADSDPAGSLLGIIYKLSEKVVLDGGIRFGLNDSTLKWGSTIGVSITF